ncbi:MAG: transposase [Desulfobacterales bacterium]|nr:transposase [Desulfobacterales bacterium]
MHHNLISEQNQTVTPEKLSIFANFFSEFKIGSLLNKSGISKTKGAAPLAVFTIVFNLAFTGKNFFQGIVKDKKITIGKDAVYNFLNSPSYNWRRFTLLLSTKIYLLIRHLLDDCSEEVLIFDDSLYDRNRSKKVELLSRVFDHNTKKYLKGFRMLTLGWSDGNSFLGLDFSLLSSAKQGNRYNGITKDLDKRTCGYQRRKEAMTKSTELMEPMFKRALAMGVRAKYLLMDSWFSAPSIISKLRSHIHIICMLKDHPNWLYEYRGKKLRLRDLYGKLKKKPGRAKIKASVLVKLPDGQDARIIFVPSDKKRGWLARYNLLALFQRQQVDQRSFGDLFRFCNEEMENIKFIDALKVIMQMAMAAIHKSKSVSEKIVQTIMNAVMGAAIIFFGLDNNELSLMPEA